MENKVVFKKEPLSATVVRALDFIGVDIDDFNLKEEYFDNTYRNDHDPRHLYRVMINCALIAKAVNKPHQGFKAFCGAYIHDLALLHNGGGNWHGRKAVDTKWFVLEEALAGKYELTPTDVANIKAAVVRHCDGQCHPDEIKDYDTNQILRVADALDRARFSHPRARLDASLIKYAPLLDSDQKINTIFKELIDESEALYWFTHRSNTYVTFRDFISLIR